MPAVTVDDLTVLRRLPRARLGDRPRPVMAGDHRAARLRGGGLPGTPRVRRHRPRRARPVHPHGPDGRGGVRARRAQGHAVAPAPRLRDRHLHDRRRLRPPGQPRRRRLDHQRRHPVDDRRLRHAAHRDAAGVAGAVRRAVPRHPALGEPPARRRSGPTRTTRTSAPARSALLTLRRRRRAGPRHRRRRSAGTPAPGRRTPRWRWCTRRSSPARASTCRGSVDFNALVYVLAGAGTVGAERRAVETGQLAVLGAGDFLTSPPTAAGEPHAGARRDRRSAAGRSASRSPGAGRS